MTQYTLDVFSETYLTVLDQVNIEPSVK